MVIFGTNLQFWLKHEIFQKDKKKGFSKFFKIVFNQLEKAGGEGMRGKWQSKTAESERLFTGSEMN